MRKSRVVVLVLAAVAAGIVISAAFNLSPITSAFLGGHARTGDVVPAAAGVRLVPADIPTLVREVSPAVVNVSTTQTVRLNRPRMRAPFGGNDPFEDFWNNFFGNMPKEQKRRSLGSGFIVSEDGYVLTNNHVVEKADEITVNLLDKEEYKAEIVGTDPKTDIALIKIKGGNGRKFPHVRLGDSEGLEVGEWVLAIGNPFGLGHTVTQGIVSAKGRIIGSGPYDDYIQTDASINPGNSGGPLFNLKGEVIGINAAIIQGGQGIGFAIPIRLAKSVLGQLKEKGKVTRGWLGVYIQRLTPDIAADLNVSGKKGALVASTTEGGPAEKAGIRSGDVIVSFDGKAITDEHDLPGMVAATKPGKKVSIGIIRDGRETAIPVTIAEMAGEPEAKAGRSEAHGGIGLTLQDITPELASRFEIANRKGVIVAAVEPGSAAEDAGFQEGDIIRQVNRQAVANTKEFTDAVKKTPGGKSVLFLVERGDARIFISVKRK